MIAALAAALLLALRPPATAAPAREERPAGAAVQGRVRSAGERTPVAGARVFATGKRGDWTREATTGPDGRFLLSDLPARDFTITIVATGHARLEQPTTAAYWSGRRPPEIYLQPSGAGHYRTIVDATREQRPSPSSVQLSPEEFSKLPGSQGDPLRGLQNLPGMARVPGGLGLLVIRGATPDQSQVFFGEHPLPRGFHIPGIASIVPGEVLGGIRYTPGNFDSSYGNAVGGIVALQPRVGRRDGIHGHVKLDIISAGARVEGPWRRGSFLIAAQRGYLDLALRALKPLIGPFVQPRSYDYQLIFDHPVGAGARLTTRMLGAGDEVRYPVDFTGDQTIPLVSNFHRVDLVYRKRHERWDFLLAPALRLDSSGAYLGTFTRQRRDTVGLLRAEMTVRPGRRLALTLGADTQLDRYATTSRASQGPEAEDLVEAARGLATSSGAYTTATLTLGPVTLTPGLRVSAFTSAGSRAAAVDPRLFARWAPHERVALNLGAGLYSQPSLAFLGSSSGLLSGLANPGLPLSDGATLVIPNNLDGGAIVLPGAVRYLDTRLAFDPRNGVGASRAVHLSAGVHAELAASLTLDATAFYRRVKDNLRPIESYGGTTMEIPDRPIALPDTGSRAFGLEVLLRKTLTRRLHGWVAYTWLRADKGVFDDAWLRAPRPADFDQTHNLVVALLLRLPRRWELGGRFRVVSGLPFTPLLAPVLQQDSYAGALAGEPNSARMPVFHQLDVRIDKTWVLRRSVVAAYFDIQNIYNHQNAEAILYNRYYTAITAVVGVPILPVLGVRVSY